MKKAMMTVMIAAFSLLIVGCQPPQGGEQTEETQESYGAAPVKVYKVQKTRISEKLNYTGLIEAVRKLNVTPEVGGKIAKIYVEEGTRVKAGQLLAELDTRAIRLQLDQAEAGVAVAEANFNDAKRNMDRMERLSKENAVSEQQYEKIRLGYEAAEAQLQQARAVLNLAKHQLDVSIMTAPFEGIIASKNAEVGDVINPMMGGLGPGGVLTLMDFSRVKIHIDVPPAHIARIQKGQKAILQVSTYPGREFQGKVTVVNLTADPATRKFRVEVLINNPDLALRPNTFGEVIVEVSTREDALVIPQMALLNGSYVYIVQGEKAVKKDVTLGLQNTDMIEITEGVSEGDLVIVEGNYGLEEGAEVEIKEEIK